MEDAGITLYKLRVLCEVVEQQGFTAAAERLNTTQPALSVHMRSLERFFGARLVRQEARRTVPTDAGAAAYRYAKEVLRETETLRQFVSDVAAGSAGHVAVAGSPTAASYLLPEPITCFREQYPRSSIALHAAPTGQVAADTLGGLSDFAVLELVSELPGMLATEPLREEPVVFVVRPAHRLAGCNVDAFGLSNEPLVLGASGSHLRGQLEWRLVELGVKTPPTALELPTAEAIKRAVATGAGIAALYWCEVADELRLGLLAEVRVAEVELAQQFGLVFRRNKRFSPMARRLLEYLRKALRSE